MGRVSAGPDRRLWDLSASQTPAAIMCALIARVLCGVAVMLLAAAWWIVMPTEKRWTR